MIITLFENFRAIFYAPFYMASILKAFEEEGLEVNIKPSSNPGDSLKAILLGEGEITWGGQMRVMVTYDENPHCDLAMFCEVVGRDPFFLVGRKANRKFQFNDLLGKKIAIVSEVATPWMCLQHDLRLSDIDLSALSIISNQSMQENISALRASDVDIIQTFQPFADDLVRENEGHIWYSAASRGPACYTCLNTTKSFALHEPDALYKITRAMFRTQKWVENNDGKSISDAIASYFPRVPKKSLLESIQRYKSLGIWNRTPHLTREGFEWLNDACLSGGLIRNHYHYDDCVLNEFAERAITENPPALP